MLFRYVHNWRDLGGHIATTGRAVRSNVLFRSAVLTPVGHEDLEQIAALGIRTTIDLRTADERAQFGGDPPFPARHMAMPLLDPDDLEATEKVPTLGEAYVQYLRRRRVGGRLVAVLRMVADQGNLPVVLSCSAGKDRTGLVVATILASLGVPDDAIADDYAASDPHLDALYASWALNPASTIGERLRTSGHLLRAPREAMETVLAEVRSEHGSMREYLAAHGADQGLFGQLEHALLEDGFAREPRAAAMF